ncbi:metallo-beta-lactamase [Ornatilinea apprima]|uniref:Metallo-beta-lactamase n=1 Tax=Ornatilinea apprima TaxID=1134406 RepID=A0A0P6YBR8_9CHLR|nr:MBL fold metallo-hydrolase [Ornatilinea apprima]KPL79390.1 metallo-beta-lactamase [Ornatilinea apprima]
MQIHFHGAAQTVTGSKHLLEINGNLLLLDCGLFQGKRADTYTANQTFNFDPSDVDAVILSHAHIDHSGNLPNLVKNGFRGKIYATRGTARLSEIMLRDAGHIQEQDAVYVNKKRRRKGQPPVEPLYTVEDVERVLPLFETVDYDRPFEPFEGVTARFVEAGHILGSAAVVLDVRENGKQKRVWFSGDIGRYKLPLLRDPVLPQNTDYLLMESTYGDKLHRDPEAAYAEFVEVVARTIKRGGKVIIPAFAVGRTQELVYNLNRAIADQLLPHIPVYVDSPLAVGASDIFREFPEYFDQETWEFIDNGRHKALYFKELVYTRSVDESKAINDIHKPMVIISASGMAETGRILHHLRHNIEDPRSTILIVSWQAPDTLGRRLAEQAREVRIFGEEYYRRAEVATIGGLSAHAGQDLLLDYAAASRDTLKHIYLVHGEERGALPLMAKIREQHIAPVSFPGPKSVVEI